MDVKWIKLSTDIFNNRKIRQIEKLPDGDALVVIWLKLLVLAGTVNDGGAVYLTREIPYTDQLLSTEFDRPLTTIQMALKVFQQFGMIDLIDDVLYVSNWQKYQDTDKLEQMREQNRLRQARFREKRKALQSTSNVTSCDEVTLSNAVEVDKEEDKDKEKDKEKDISTIQQAWNDSGLQKIRGIVPQSERERLLKARIKEHGKEAVLEAIRKASTSTFLRGQNRNGWTITFDWFVKPRNFLKVLEGNYDDKRSNSANAQKSANEWGISYD